MKEALARFYQMLRPQDPGTAATSTMTSPQLGMLNRMLGLSVNQVQGAVEATPEKLRQSRELLDQYTPGQPINPKLLDQFMNLAGWGTMGMTYRVTTPLKPDPEVGTRFKREYIGGLAEKKPVKIEDLKGSSAMIMPWDSTSRNMKVTSISDEFLPKPVITHGGQDYSRDLMHIEKNVAGASNLGTMVCQPLRG
jgi:hypothetical protein